MNSRSRRRLIALSSLAIALAFAVPAVALPPRTFPVPEDTPPVIFGVTARSITSSSATIAWKTNEPADSQVEFGLSTAYGTESTLDTARVTIHGVVLDALAEGTAYHYRVKSRDLGGNLAVSPDFAFTTAVPPPTLPTDGIWIGRSELATQPTSGPAWDNVKAEADQACGTPDLSNQDSRVNVCVMAKALVFARTGLTNYRDDVVAAVDDIVGSGTYSGRALALGRELAAYVIAADLIDLKAYDSVRDSAFRAKIRSFLTTPTTSGPGNLIECHEVRPNNWGTHCGASRVAVAAYLNDSAELARVAQVFKGWLGDRSSYASFVYGDLSWQCDPAAPVGINPRGCTKQGHSIDGVLPDDQRRGGSFSWPPPKENYVYEGLQGALAQAVMLSRRGYDAFGWQDNALLRAFQWLHAEANYPAAGDDTWQPHLVNHFYGTAFPAPIPSSPGKNVGWTDWTHA